MDVLLRRKMRDTATLYTVATDAYGKKTVTSVGTIAALLVTGKTRVHAEARIDEVSQDTLFIDPSVATIANAAGQITGLVVKVQKQNYAAGTDAEHWYVITATRVATDSLITNRTGFMRCSLQKIEQP